MATNLIVPVNLLALCVTDQAAHTNLRGPSADFRSFPVWDGAAARGELFLGTSIDAFAERGPGVGVHLHWSLPDALTRGTQDPATGATSFPQVPNRWLVTRIATRAQDPQPRFKSWVLESNQQVLDDAGQGSPTMPFIESDPDAPRAQYFRYMGRAFDYDPPRTSSPPAAPSPAPWTESGCNNALTALGYGDAAFAAYYPNCRNVFGFFDDFTQTLTACDADGGPPETGAALGDAHVLTYVVVGWYAAPDHDPMAAAPVDGGDNPLAWAFDGGTPTATLCSGAIYDVAWDPARNDLAATQSALEVAVGNTSAEALSALVADAPAAAGDPDAEYLLNAVQQGLLTRLLGDDQHAAKLALVMHRAQFSSAPGGSVWSVKPVGTASFDTGGAKAPPAALLPVPIARALDALNAAQQSYDAGTRELASRARQLFSDWYRQQVASAATPDGVIAQLAPLLVNDPDENDNTLSQLVQAGLTALQGRAAAIGTLAYRRSDGTDTVAAGDPGPSLATAAAAAYGELAALLPAGAYLIQRAPGPGYWVPNDPVVVLRGDDVAPSARYGAPPRPGKAADLPCRLSGQTSDTLTYVGGATLTPAALVRQKAYARLPAGVAADAQALLAEAMVWDARFGDAIAAALCTADPRLVHDQVAADLAALRQALPDGGLGAGGLSVNGRVADARARTVYAGTPWTPLYIDWSLTYFPLAGVPAAGAAGSLDAGLVTGHHQLNQAGVDLQLNPDVAVPPAGVTYQGVVPLGRGATLDLAGELARAAQADPTDAPLADLAHHVSTAPCLSQAMSGLHRALLMQYQLPQVAIYQPFTDTATRATTAAIKEAVGSRNDVAPVRASVNQAASDKDSFFAPIRTGLAALGPLALYDAFGQVRTVTPVRTSWASALHTDDGRLVLPPRIAQPSRLLFRWLAADPPAPLAGTAPAAEVEMTDPPAASPVCGWVVPNFVDRSLALFDAMGAPLGELELIAGDSDVVWHPAPRAGGPVLPDAPDEQREIEQIRAAVWDPTLCAFALGVLQGSPGYLDAMVRAIDNALTTVLPAGDPRDHGIATLMGRPLVLARASLALDLQGLPSPDQGWPTLQAEVLAADQPDAAARQNRGFTAVPFPVRLGDLAMADDGLVGYFRVAGTAQDFATFYSPGAVAGTPGVVSSDVQPLTTSFAAGPATVALLFDPHGCVNATTGILPVQALTLPGEQYAPALASLAVYFYVGPLLLSGGAPALPLPRLPGMAWSWRQAVQGHWQTADTRATAGDRAAFGYDPLRLAEGWAVLETRKTTP